MTRKITKEQRLARQRELQSAAEARKQREQRQRRMIRLGGGAAVVLVLLLTGFIYAKQNGTSSTPAVAASLAGLPIQPPTRWSDTKSSARVGAAASGQE